MKRIKQIISEMNGELSKEELIKNENQLLATVVSRTMFFLAVILGFLLIFFSNKEFLMNLLYFAVFFSCSLLLLLLRQPKKISPVVNTFFISLIFSLIDLFMFFFLFEYVSYLIWIILAVQMICAMFINGKIMTLVVGITFFITVILAVLFPERYCIKPGIFFYIGLIMAFIAMYMILYFLNKVNKNRYYYIQKKQLEEKEAKEEMTALYEEIAASEEELREKNEKLQDYFNELHNMAYYDALTGLPNRKLIIETIENQIKESGKENTKFYVVYIDTDGFKRVNDAMGHYVGDEFLIHISNKLKDTVSPKDILGRIGGDEFAYIIRRDIDKKQVAEEIEKIRKTFQTPFNLKTTEIILTASFGVATFPDDGDTMIKLLKNADISMYKAKELGKNRIQFFDTEIKEEFLKEARIEKNLFKALDNEEFYLVFQPQYDALNEKIRGFETLLRWNSKEIGMISPLVFIPKAEEMRYIIPLGKWVLKTACEKYMKFREVYKKDFIISVNISMLQLEDKDFVKNLKDIIDETNVDPKMLELEITESESSSEIIDLIYKLFQIKDMGVRIALDDFGTGYSSLNHLKRLPIDILKIDKTFIDDLNAEVQREHIVKDIISLVHSLGIKTVVEGVENREQMEILKEYKCDFIQGFLLSRPLEENKVMELLKTQS